MEQDTRMLEQQEMNAPAEQGKKVLFCAESVYQVFNAVTLRMTERKEDVCDLCLSNHTTWDEGFMQRLEESGLFEHIVLPDVRSLDERYWDLDMEQRMAAVKEPELYFCGEWPLQDQYKELFVSIDHIFWKMLYRNQVYMGSLPAVYMYDEGVRAYTMPLFDTDNKPYLRCAEYMEHSFIDAVKGYYLYRPSVYSVKHTYPLLQMPNPKAIPEVRDMLLHLYGYEAMPEEPYIYLEDFFFADHHVTNDFDLFKEIVGIVGGENIVVKRHPRDQYDRFEPLGFKTLGASVVPWEIQLLANDYRQKVLISVSSTSILTPYIIFNTDMHVISLEKMFVGENPTHKDVAFRAFFEALKDQINEDTIRFHTPSSTDELQEVIRYLKMVTKRGGNDNE